MAAKKKRPKSSGRGAIVTGGARGIGRATALVLARAGHRVVVADLDLAAAEATAADIEREGGSAVAVETDVTELASIRRAVRIAAEPELGLGCAVNNAGLAGDAPNLATFDRIFTVNFDGVRLSMKAELPLMIRSGGGVIVNVGSSSGLFPHSRSPIYGGAKAAVVAMTRAVARIVAPRGVRVSCVCPGPVDTPLLHAGAGGPAGVVDAVPLGRLGTAEEVAEAIGWLCSPAAAYVAGAVLAVDGGASAW